MSAGRTLLRTVRVFDGQSVLAPGTVLIDGAVVGEIRRLLNALI